MTARSYLSIGDVLTLLRQEFPDVTISKIRFLESQGLVNPERTPSGYRKFYEHDVERLRWVLRQQREHFLPLKVIKDRLEEDGLDPGESPATSSGSDAPDPAASPAEEPVLVGQRARAEGSNGPSSGDSRPEGILLSGIEPHQVPVASGLAGRRMVTGEPAGSGDGRAGGARVPVTDPPTAPAAVASDAGPGPTAGEVEAAGSVPPTELPGPGEPPRRPAPSRRGKAESPGGGAEAPSPPLRPEPPTAAPSADPDIPDISATGDDGGSLSLEELAAACGLEATVITELQEFGLLTPRSVAGVGYFDEEALAIAQLAARFGQFGIEPRHLRLYKNAADREAGFVEQILLPLVRQRNPEARARAQQTADDLAGLGQQLRSALLRRALADLLGG